MPYEDAKTYQFNPFDLTKVWPHSDYPLIKVGTMTLNKNPDNFFAQIEQSAFEPSAIVPGIGFSPDKMLLGRAFAYSDTHRYRIGPNYLQLPVNRPRVELNTYTQDGPMAFDHNGDAPVYAPNSRAAATPTRSARSRTAGRPTARWCARHTRCAPTTTTSARPATLVRDVWNDEQREAFVETVAGHLLGGVKSPVLERAFDYWKKRRRRARAPRSRSWCAPASAAPNPGGQADDAKVVKEPMVEEKTYART